jgi:nucleotide-binding universal stress UspA family protein
MAAAVEEFFKKFPKLETRVELGSPAEKILALVQKEKVDMIIMGAHGRAGLERVIFGSVANKVVKSAPCPVLTIHP